MTRPPTRKYGSRRAWLLVLLLVLVALTWSSARAAAAWSFVAALRDSRTAHGAAVSGFRIFCIGGSASGGSYHVASEMSDVNVTSWVAGSVSGMPSAKGEHGVAELGGRIYAVGGSNGSSVQSSVFAYNPEGNTWSTVAPLNTARRGLAAAASGGKLYAIGGVAGDGLATASVEVYDPISNTWSYAAPLNFARFYPSATTAADGRIYVVGGQASDGTIYPAGEVYDPVANTWTLITPNLLARVAGAAVTGDDGKIYALGGSLGAAGVTNTVEAYNPQTGAWSLVAPMNSPRAYFAAVLYFGRIYAIGGGNPNDGQLRTVEAYQANLRPGVEGDKTVVVPEDTVTSLGSYTPSDGDGDPVTITVDEVPPAAKGIVRLSAAGAEVIVGQSLTPAQIPALVFSPALNTNGAAGAFRYTASDGVGGVRSQTVTLIVTAANDAPVATAESYSVLEEGLLDVPAPGVLANDSDPDGDSLSTYLAVGAAHGALTLFGDGSFIYQPNANYSGPDSFVYHARDSNDTYSPQRTVTLNVAPVNDLPVASDQSVTTSEDTARTVNLGVADADGNPLTYSVVSGPVHGTVSGLGSSPTYTPAPNYRGADSFTFRANDGTGDSNTATVSITVTSVEDVPIAQSGGADVTEDTPTAVSLGASDGDGDALTYTIVTPPAHGVLSDSGASRTFIPSANYTGSDSFTFRASDGKANSNTATVLLSIVPVNDSPVAAGSSVVVPEDSVTTIPLSATDAEGNSLTYSVVSLPAHGSLTGSGASRIYTPDADFNGNDSFTFRVNDGTSDSNTATVSIAITGVNDPPVARDGYESILEDTAANIALPATDVEGNTLSFSLVSLPTHGTLSGTGASRVYTPAADYTGPDSFTFRVSDGAVTSTTATIDLIVLALNDPPFALSTSATVQEDTPTTIPLPALDQDGDALTYAVSASPTHGTLTGVGDSRTYTPAPNFTGTDSFTFRVNDGTTESDTATIAITVLSVNDAPVASGASVAIGEEGAVVISLSASDPDSGALTYAITGQPAHGTLSGSGASRTYTPAANYTGPDSFTFRANDGAADSNTATISISVTPVNDAPVAVGASLTLAEDTPLPLILGGTDADGDALAYQVLTLPAHGTLSGTGASRTYTPAANYNGEDSFTFRVSDGSGTSNTATIDLTVNPVNDPPVAVGEAAGTLEDTPLSLTLSASDPDGDPLTFLVTAAPAHGVLSGAGANRTYTPAPQYSGSDSITFRVSDGRLDSSPASVTVTVLPVIDGPATEADAYEITEDTSLLVPAPGVLENDLPGEGGSLTAARISGPSHGSLALNANGGFNYTPAADFNGTDSFTYRAREGAGASAPTTVILTVTPVNDVPVATNATATVAEDGSVSIPLSATDADGDALTYAVITGPAHGLLNGSGAARTYTPSGNFSGVDSFTFRVSDRTATSSLATISITVTGVNDPPAASAGPGQTVEATGATTPVNLTALGSFDADGDPLTYTWSEGETGLGSDAALTVPLSVGAHSISLVARDPAGVTATDSVTITVRDTKAPTLTLPANLVVPQNSPNGAVVEFTVNAADAVSTPALTVSPASGSVFPLGPTTVTVTATDTAGNRSTGSFQVNVVAPTSTSGKVTAKGAILVGGQSAKLALTAQQVPGKPLKASLSFTDPVSRQTLKSTSITALVVEGKRARVFGQGTLTSGGTIRFVAEAEDLGTARGVDRFRLELSDGRVFGPAPLSTGSVSITR